MDYILLERVCIRETKGRKFVVKIFPIEIAG